MVQLKPALLGGRDCRMRPWLMAGAVSLLAAIPPIWPYAYYTLLRLFVCGVAIGAIVGLGQRNRGLLTAFVLVALLFNPVIPVHLTKGIWAIVDFIVAIFFFYAASRSEIADTRRFQL